MILFFDNLIRWLRIRKIKKYIKKNSVICDVGCGSDGYLLKRFSYIIKYGFGFDKKVSNYTDSKIKLSRVKMFKEIPCSADICDIVVMIAVLEHLTNPQEILNECYRILKKNGKLIITTPSYLAKPILEFLAFKLKLINGDEIRDHKNYFKMGEIKKMLLEAGFKETNIKLYFFELYLNQLIIATK